MNWTLILAEIFESGMTQTAIAEFCGCRQSTISDLSRGKATTPSFDLGQKLMTLHARIKKTRKRSATSTASEESNEELRRESDLSYRQPADPKKVAQ